MRRRRKFLAFFELGLLLPTTSLMQDPDLHLVYERRICCPICMVASHSREVAWYGLTGHGVVWCGVALFRLVWSKHPIFISKFIDFFLQSNLTICIFVIWFTRSGAETKGTYSFYIIIFCQRNHLSQNTTKLVKSVSLARNVTNCRTGFLAISDF
jgi:hypothetical protein